MTGLIWHAITYMENPKLKILNTKQIQMFKTQNNVVFCVLGLGI